MHIGVVAVAHVEVGGSGLSPPTPSCVGLKKESDYDIALLGARASGSLYRRFGFAQARVRIRMNLVGLSRM